MEKQTNTVGDLFEKTRDYVETRIELVKLKTVNTVSDITSSIASRLIIVLLSILMLLLLNVGIAIWLGEMLGKMYYGFFLVTAFYLLLIIVLYIFRNKWLKGPLYNKLIRKMLN